jgi:hypothetical protein
MTKFVPIETIRYQLSKIRKSSNFNYLRGIERRKKKQVKHPPLTDLIVFLRNKNCSEEVIDEAVKEYWNKLESDKNFEIDFANKLKIKYSK